MPAPYPRLQDKAFPVRQPMRCAPSGPRKAVWQSLCSCFLCCLKSSAKVVIFRNNPINDLVKPHRALKNRAWRLGRRPWPFCRPGLRAQRATLTGWWWRGARPEVLVFLCFHLKLGPTAIAVVGAVHYDDVAKSGWGMKMGASPDPSQGGEYPR